MTAILRPGHFQFRKRKKLVSVLCRLKKTVGASATNSGGLSSVSSLWPEAGSPANDDEDDDEAVAASTK